MKRILIEFYSKRTPENLLSLLKEPFDGAVFFCFADTAPEERVRDQLTRVIERLCGWRPVFHVISEKTLEAALEALDGMEKDILYTVDLTGGEAALLAAAGYFAHKREGVCLHQYDVRTGKLLFSYPVTPKPSPCPFHLDAESYLTMSGSAPLRVPRHHFNRGPLKEEILRLWNAVRRNLSDWNSFCSLPGSEKDAKCRLDRKYAGRRDSAKQSLRRITDKLARAGILRDLKETKENGKLGMEYTLNVPEEAKFLYDKAGNLLEMYAALAAHEAGVFHDLCVGVEVDWNGVKERHHTPDPRNEIDLFFMREDLPVVGSCKNTFPKNDYLYEIAVMAGHYGGFYATPLLVSSFTATPTVRKRAAEMGVLLLDGLSTLPFSRAVDFFKKKFR